MLLRLFLLFCQGLLLLLFSFSLFNLFELLFVLLFFNSIYLWGLSAFLRHLSFHFTFILFLHPRLSGHLGVQTRVN